jgi:hypothetical protein
MALPFCELFQALLGNQTVTGRLTDEDYGSIIIIIINGSTTL